MQHLRSFSSTLWHGRSEESVLSGDYDSYFGGSQYVHQYPNYAMPVTTVHSNFPSSPHRDDILAHAIDTTKLE